MTGGGGEGTIFRELALIGRASVVARYRLDSPRGILFLLAAIFDPYIYAVTVYFVLSTVFQLGGAERFHVLLIGFIAFRWGVASLVASTNLQGILDRMAEHSRTPLCAAVVAVVTPSAFVFLLSLVSAYVFSALFGVGQQSLGAIVWLPFVIAFQGIWTVALILLLTFLRGRRLLSSDAPVIVIASLMWVLSPVMYTFRDIPEGASKILTSYNPVSHLLAAYQNSYWYGRDISLEVLPWVTVLGLGLIVLLGRYAYAGLPSKMKDIASPDGEPNGVRLIYLGTDRADTPPAGGLIRGTATFTPWRARFRDLRGHDLVQMIIAGWGLSAAERSDATVEIRQLSRIDRLFDDFLAIYPDQALDQLAFAVALSSPHRRISLHGILDTLSPGFLSVAWDAIERSAAQGRAIQVICRQPLVPPAGIRGEFRLVGAGDAEAAGPLGPELRTAYERAGAVGLPAPESAIPQAGSDAQKSLAFPAVFVTGARSQIGRCVVRRLRAAQTPIVTLGRNRSFLPSDTGPHFIEGNLDADTLPLPDALSAMIHVAPIWLLARHLDALHARGVRRIVCCSTTSVVFKKDSSSASERDLVSRIAGAEREVAERCDALGIAWTILRPTLVYGLGIDQNISRAATLIRRLGLYPLGGGATGLRQPVHADDVAAAALAALAEPAAIGKSYDLGGGEVLTYREMIGRIFDVLGRPRRFLLVPGLGALATLAGVVLRRPEVTGAMVNRMNQDLVCDNGPAERDLSYRPRAFLVGGPADLGLDGIDTRKRS